MPERQDDSNAITAAVNDRTAGRFSRRGILQLSGATLAAGSIVTDTASAGDHDEPSTSQVTADDGPLGGGDGYDRVVHPDAADVVVATRDELSDALTSASSGDVVYVAGEASIDLGEATFTVPDGVTLASDRGIDGAAGGHLYTVSETDVVDVGDGARVSGIRMEGPFYEYFDPGWYARGSGLRALGENVEIDNCEVWGFAYAAIYADGDAHIHHNYVHHNARDGLGYGVVTVGDHPLIEWNYFEYNRRSVASTGDHHGYTVRYNRFGSEAASGVIDVHRPGGVRSAVHNNIVEAVDDVEGGHGPLQAVQVRGVPEESYDVHENWFFNPEEPHGSPPAPGPGRPSSSRPRRSGGTSRSGITITARTRESKPATSSRATSADASTPLRARDAAISPSSAFVPRPTRSPIADRWRCPTRAPNQVCPDGDHLLVRYGQ